MKKIGIIRCFEVASRCSGSGCIKAFNNKTGAFDKYNEPADITIAIPCRGCSENSLEEILTSARQLKVDGVETIHLSSCIRSKCKWYDKFQETLSKEFDVIGYTHGNKK